MNDNGALLDSPPNNVKLSDFLLNNDYAKFGDAIVNFIYNAAIYEATQKLQGIKVWDYSLAQACKNSPLRQFVGSRKNAGELGDAVESFIAYVYLKNKSKLNDSIRLLARYISKYKLSEDLDEKELCAKAFTSLIITLCEDMGITH